MSKVFLPKSFKLYAVSRLDTTITPSLTEVKQPNCSRSYFSTRELVCKGVGVNMRLYLTVDRFSEVRSSATA